MAVNIKVGDIYIRHSDGKVCRVKWSDHKTIVLESEDGNWIALAEIVGLEKGYRKKEIPHL